MQVQMLYFGVLKDLLGAEREAVKIVDGSSAAELLTMIESRVTRQSGLWKSLAVAVNQEYVQSTHVLHDGDEVALLPPVSGGWSFRAEATGRYAH